MKAAISRYGARVFPETEDIVAACKARGELVRGPQIAQFEAALDREIRRFSPRLLALAGFMRVLTPEFVGRYRDRVLNIHPSLLPAFPGLNAQVQAFNYGAKVAGCSVHFVDEAVDHGVIILQRTVPVNDDDTAETLSARILEQEHLAYPEAIARVLSGDYVIQGRRYVRRDDEHTSAKTQ